MKVEDVILNSYLDIEEFNEIAGNLQGDMEKQVDNQLSYIFEELSEAIKSFEEGDAANLLKEACDVWVTTAGLLQKLEAAGFDVASALAKVDANNLSKFPAFGDAVQYDSAFTAELNPKYQRYVIKDGGGKVRKPSNFVNVDVAEFAPADFFSKR